MFLLSKGSSRRLPLIPEILCQILLWYPTSANDEINKQVTVVADRLDPIVSATVVYAMDDNLFWATTQSTAATSSAEFLVRLSMLVSRDALQYNFSNWGNKLLP